MTGKGDSRKSRTTRIAKTGNKGIKSVDWYNGGKIKQSDRNFKIYNNTEQSIIQISEDRLELNARDYTENIKSIPEISGWGGIIVSITLTGTTAEFQDAWGLTGEQVKMSFEIVSFFLICKIIKQIFYFIKYKCFISERAFNPKSFVKKCRTNEMSNRGGICWWRRCFWRRILYKFIKNKIISGN